MSEPENYIIYVNNNNQHLYATIGECSGRPSDYHRAGPVKKAKGTRRKQLPGLNVILTLVFAPGGVQVHSEAALPPLDQGPHIAFRHAPSGAEVGSGGRRIPSRGKMPLVTTVTPPGSSRRISLACHRATNRELVSRPFLKQEGRQPFRLESPPARFLMRPNRGGITNRAPLGADVPKRFDDDLEPDGAAIRKWRCTAWPSHH